MTHGYELVEAKLVPDHAPRVPGMVITRFRRPPMTYIFVFTRDAKPVAWPDSLDEATATALAQRFVDRLKK